MKRTKKKFRFQATWIRHESFLVQSGVLGQNREMVPHCISRIRKFKFVKRILECGIEMFLATLKQRLRELTPSLHPLSYKIVRSQRKTTCRCKTNVWGTPYTSGNNVVPQLKNSFGWNMMIEILLYFHATTIGRRQRNNIHCLEVRNGRGDIVAFYPNLYSSSNPQSNGICSLIHPKVTPDMVES